MNNDERVNILRKGLEEAQRTLQDEAGIHDAEYDNTAPTKCGPLTYAAYRAWVALQQAK